MGVGDGEYNDENEDDDDDDEDGEYNVENEDDDDDDDEDDGTVEPNADEEEGDSDGACNIDATNLVVCGGTGGCVIGKTSCADPIVDGGKRDRRD